MSTPRSFKRRPLRGLRKWQNEAAARAHKLMVPHMRKKRSRKVAELERIAAFIIYGLRL